MECSERHLPDQWIACWNDIVDFELIGRDAGRRVSLLTIHIP